MMFRFFGQICFKFKLSTLSYMEYLTTTTTTKEHYKEEYIHNQIYSEFSRRNPGGESSSLSEVT